MWMAPKHASKPPFPIREKSRWNGKIPSTISITVDTAEVAAAVEQENGQILLVDDSYKILETVRQAPDDVLLIKGLQAKDPHSRLHGPMGRGGNGQRTG